MPSNALITETLRGLSFTGRPHRDYLLCIAVQAVAVLLWWPKSGYVETDTSLTLFAALIAIAVTLGYHSARLGAEELTVPQQQSLREWLLSTSVPVRRLLVGYLVSHILQTVHWLLLSTPVLLIAWSVSGIDWQRLAYGVFSIVVLASIFRLTGSCLYLALGHHKTLMRHGVRAIVPVTYVLLGFMLPVSSHWQLTDELLGLSRLSQWSSESSSAMFGFLGFYGTCLVLLSCGLGLLSWRIRNRSGL
jgi:hypothetical protein